MDKIERAVSLHRLLLDHRTYGISIKDACEKLEDCHRATFYRIKDTTAELYGLDIIIDPKTGKYNYDYENGVPQELPSLWFKKSELIALVCLQNAISFLQSGYLKNVLSPFENRFKPILKSLGISVDDWKSRFKFIKIFERPTDSNVFEIVTDAVISRKKISIRYKKSGQEPEERTISPQTILHYRDNWYVDGFCELRNGMRTFAISRIISVKPFKEKAKNIPKKELEEHYQSGYGIYDGISKHEAVIKFTGYAAIEVAQEEWHPRQKSEQPDTGTYIVRIPYSQPKELIMDVLRWGHEAEILEPASLRTEIAEILKKSVQKYS